jgi:hypothetical protein
MGDSYADVTVTKTASTSGGPGLLGYLGMLGGVIGGAFAYNGPISPGDFEPPGDPNPTPESDTPWKNGVLCAACLIYANGNDEARVAGCASMFPPGNGEASRVMYARCAAATTSKPLMKNWCEWNLCKP